MSVYEGLSETQQFACRVIADHARSTAFAIADGILPGNEGRNYVLRKIMRRAIYHGREHLGLTDPFFYKVCDFVVEQMREAYPELEVQRDFIGKMVRVEEERFGNTVTVGLGKLESLFAGKSATRLQALTDQQYLARILGDADISNYQDEIVRIREERSQLQNMNWNKAYARLAFENRITPSLITEIMRAKFPEDPFNIQSFALELARYVTSSGTEAERSIGKLFDSGQYPEFFQRLDRYYEDLNVFKPFAQLYDTYGTPRDLIRLFLEEKGIAFEEEEFNEKFDAALQEIQQQGGIGKTERKSQISPIYSEVLERVGKNRFHGYDATQIEDAEVIALVKDDKRVEELNEGEEGLIVLSDTPFYAEAGGQVGDTGVLVRTAYGSGRLNVENLEGNVKPPAIAGGSDSLSRIKVLDTFAPISGIILHKSRIEQGSIKIGDKVTATVDVEKRDATRRNHTATHLVHAALREVLGTHVKQGGSVVAPNYLRFDFTHYQPISEGELTEVEDLVNRYILENHPVNTNIMAIEEAMRGGAMALFGEKYGSDVRVLSVGDGVFSKELCGGTHVRATGDIGSFKITSDEAIASGVRRIRAITGFDAFERFREDEKLIDRSLGALKTQRDNLPNAIERLQEKLKRTRKENDELKLKIATGAGGPSSNGDEAKDICGVTVLGKIVNGLDANGTRQLSDTLLNRLKSGVVILGRRDEEKASIIVRVSDDLTDKIKAGNVIKEIAPIIGGRGGGKADMAEGGGSEPGKLAEAIDASYGIIERMLV